MNSFFRLRKPKTKPIGEEAGAYIIAGREIDYVIQRKSRRYRIALYIEASGRLRFVAPLRTRTERITQILDTRGDWIADKLAKIRQRPAAPGVPQYFRNGEKTYYLGRSYDVRVIENSSQQGCRIEAGTFEIHLMDVENADQEARLEALLWYKKQAKHILMERTDIWAEKLHLKYRSVKVTNPLRQWGSCSVKNDIRYNWRVILGPLAAVDYLVAHELCHITHKNHSQRFWNLLASVMPDHKERRKILHAMDSGFAL